VAARSGTPYSEQIAATPEAISGQPGRPITKGSLNGARLPWYFRLNMRVWKDFAFEVGKKKANKDNRRQLSFQIYLQIQNLLECKKPCERLPLHRHTG
jgi:hypothetical protein